MPVEEECKARDESNRVARLKLAAFPVHKQLESFDLSVSSLSQATYDYLTSLEWLKPRRNVALVGRPGTGKSHLAIALARAAVEDHRVRFFRADALVEQLYRGLADNTVGKVIDRYPARRPRRH